MDRSENYHDQERLTTLRSSLERSREKSMRDLERFPSVARGLEIPRPRRFERLHTLARSLERSLSRGLERLPTFTQTLGEYVRADGQNNR